PRPGQPRRPADGDGRKRPPVLRAAAAPPEVALGDGLGRSGGRDGARAIRLPRPLVVPDLDLAVERVPLNGDLAERANRSDEVLRRRSVPRPAGRDDGLI